MQASGAHSPAIISPSYENRRGHPVLLTKSLWGGVLGLGKDQTLRDFLREREGEISYLVVDDPGILHDLDTPEEYRHAMDLDV
jgi:molybdenum cofactor cytidylyltransferase